MSKTHVSRKQRFFFALDAEGISLRAWAAQHGLSAGHVSQAAAGKREDCQPTIDLIEAFCAKRGFPRAA